MTLLHIYITFLRPIPKVVCLEVIAHIPRPSIMHLCDFMTFQRYKFSLCVNNLTPWLHHYCQVWRYSGMHYNDMHYNCSSVTAWLWLYENWWQIASWLWNAILSDSCRVILGAVDKTSSSFSAHGKIGNFIIIIIITTCTPSLNFLLLDS